MNIVHASETALELMRTLRDKTFRSVIINTNRTLLTWQDFTSDLGALNSVINYAREFDCRLVVEAHGPNMLYIDVYAEIQYKGLPVRFSTYAESAHVARFDLPGVDTLGTEHHYRVLIDHSVFASRFEAFRANEVENLT